MGRKDNFVRNRGENFPNINNLILIGKCTMIFINFHKVVQKVFFQGIVNFISSNFYLTLNWLGGGVFGALQTLFFPSPFFDTKHHEIFDFLLTFLFCLTGLVGYMTVKTVKAQSV